MNDLVSIVIPSYNSAHLVSDAIHSVLNQTHPNVEAIVIDDGSTDNVREVVQALALQDARVKYFYQDNLGLGGARSTGITKAQGEYIAFLDADDLFLPHKIKLQLDALMRDPALGLVAGGYRITDIKTGSVLAQRQPWEDCPTLELDTWLVTCAFVPCCVLARTEWVRRVDGFARLRRAEDRDMWLRMSYAGCKMAWTPDIVADYRMHDGQISRDGRTAKEGTLLVLNHFYGQADLPEAVRAQRPRSYAAAWLEGAFREYGASQLEDARASFTEAVKLAPDLVTPAAQLGEIPRILYAMLSWAVYPYAGNTAEYVMRFFDHLPDEIAEMAPYRANMVLTAAVWVAGDACHVNNLMRATDQLAKALQVDPQLGQHTDLARQRLIDFVRALPYEAQTRCAEKFFEALPDALQVWQGERRKVFGSLYVARGFEAHHEGQRKQAAQEMWRGVRLSPGWAKNRGVLAILLKPLIPSA